MVTQNINQKMAGHKKIMVIIVCCAIILALALILIFSTLIIAPTNVITCVPAGCSQELCMEKTAANDTVSICLWSDKYACYQSAECKVQASGKCGWTQTQELKSCLLD